MKGDHHNDRKAPRPAEHLLPVEEPLGDGVSWSGVAARREDAVAAVAENCEVVASVLRGVQFTAVELDRVRFIDVVLEDCELSGAVLSEASLTRVQFNRCRLSGLVGSGIKATDVAFIDCKMDGFNFRASSWARSEWIGCDLTEGDFYGAGLAGCGLRTCRLMGLELSKSVCTGLRLHGSELAGIKGAGALRGCVIGSDQIVALALPLFGALDITIDDEDDIDDED